MCATSDLNSVFNPPAGSPETSTVSLLDGAAVLSSGFAAGSAGVISGATAAVDLGGDSGGGSVGCGAGEEGIILFNSRVKRCISPGPLTTVVSFTKPVPGTNHRSSLIDMSDASSQ